MKGYRERRSCWSRPRSCRASSVSRAPRARLLLDLRPADAYAAGHIPGAVHLDLWGVSLIDTDPAPLKAFMWMIEHLFATRGVAGDDAGRRLRRSVRHPRRARVLVSRVLRPSVGARARRRLRRLDARGAAGDARGGAGRRHASGRGRRSRTTPSRPGSDVRGRASASRRRVHPRHAQRRRISAARPSARRAAARSLAPCTSSGRAIWRPTATSSRRPSCGMYERPV